MLLLTTTLATFYTPEAYPAIMAEIEGSPLLARADRHQMDESTPEDEPLTLKDWREIDRLRSLHIALEKEHGLAFAARRRP